MLLDNINLIRIFRKMNKKYMIYSENDLQKISDEITLGNETIFWHHSLSLITTMLEKDILKEYINDLNSINIEAPKIKLLSTEKHYFWNQIKELISKNNYDHLLDENLSWQYTFQHDVVSDFNNITIYISAYQLEHFQNELYGLNYDIEGNDVIADDFSVELISFEYDESRNIVIDLPNNKRIIPKNVYEAMKSRDKLTGLNIFSPIALFAEKKRKSNIASVKEMICLASNIDYSLFKEVEGYCLIDEYAKESEAQNGLRKIS